MNVKESERTALPSRLEDSALVSIKVVRDLCGFASSTPIYDRLRRKEFPEPVRLSKRCTRWRLREVSAWLDKQGAKA